MLQFRQVNNKLEANMNERLKEFDITLTQLNVLWYIHKNSNNPISQKDICDFLKVKHTSLIDVLKRLESKGLITRCVSKENARANSVRLTEKSMQLVKTMDENRNYMLTTILNDFTAEEAEQLEYLLSKIVNNLERR